MAYAHFCEKRFSSGYFCSMNGPKFCSMKITQDVRDNAATL
jgi:hypothetical protein